MSSVTLFASILYLLLVFANNVVSIDYGLALRKSLLYFEAQRSGKLPPNQRAQWRGDSALRDGNDVGVDLVGGYYDAGDNIKIGFPMAFTVTMLSWSSVEFESQLVAKGELSNALEAIKWGTDYLMKAHPEPYVLYGQVGDGRSDHSCWERPEDMTTLRTAYRFDEQHPGADLAGETAAALAAAAIAFRGSDPAYSSQLISHAKQLFDFATKFPGKFSDSIPDLRQLYSSSGFEDELLWAAAWLERATEGKTYAEYLNQAASSGGTRSMFSWDDKYVGSQVLVAKGLLEGRFSGYGNLGQYKNSAEQFICNCIQKGSSNVQKTSEGLLWFDFWNNLQYVTTAAFTISTYADTLARAQTTLQCPAASVTRDELITFVQSQVNYILGSNSKGFSYMVGFGPNYPQQVHHRGASIVSIKEDKTPVSCQQGFSDWFNKNAPNPNVLDGAIVGGPDQNDQYTDKRSNYYQAEVATANNAPLVGVLARLA
ncbi:endoglucanase 14-like [Coffea arabica]|uniref:Endoglucanase n=1 Tax=Coffea arabica TaxID=13443 RepID=A0ABM4WRS8_COFAR